MSGFCMEPDIGLDECYMQTGKHALTKYCPYNRDHGDYTNKHEEIYVPILVSIFHNITDVKVLPNKRPQYY